MASYEQVVSLEAQAQAAYAARLYADAVMLYSRAVTVAGRLNQPRLVAVVFNRLGDMLHVKGDVAEAAAAYEAGVQSLSTPTGPDIERVLVALASVGPRFYEFDRMEISDCSDAATAEALQSAIDDPTLAARLLLSCAQVYQHQSQADLCLDAYQRALAQLEADGMDMLRLSTMARLGVLAYQQGNMVLAQAMLDAIVQLRERLADPQMRCQWLSALGNLYAAFGRSQEALQVYRQALCLSLQVGDSATIGHMRGQLVRLTLQQRQCLRREAPRYQRSAPDEIARHNDMDAASAAEVLQLQALCKGM